MAVSSFLGMGSLVFQIPDLLPDATIHSDAEGPGGRAALIFDARAKSQGARLLKYGVSSEEQARAKGTNLIFAIGLVSVASAFWSLGGLSACLR